MISTYPSKIAASTDPCRHCGSMSGNAQRPRGPHIGEYCLSCDGWIRWVPRREKLKLVESAPIKNFNHPWGAPPQKESRPRYTPAQIAHPSSLDERVAALEHNLGILVQIFIGVERT